MNYNLLQPSTISMCSRACQSATGHKSRGYLQWILIISIFLYLLITTVPQAGVCELMHGRSLKDKLPPKPILPPKPDINKDLLLDSVNAAVSGLTSALECPKECTCSLPTNVTCSGKKLKTLPQGIKMTTATHLDVSQNNLTTLTNQDMKKLPALLELNISYNQISRIDKNTFLTNVSVITNIDLSWNNLLFLSPVIFVKTLELKKLSLAGNDGFSIYQYFLKHDKLDSLNVSHCNIVMIPNGAFDGIPKLTDLDVSHNNLKHISSDIILLTNVKKLWVENNPLECSCSLNVLDLWSTDSIRVQHLSCMSPSCPYNCLPLSWTCINSTTNESSKSPTDKDTSDTDTAGIFSVGLTAKNAELFVIIVIIIIQLLLVILIVIVVLRLYCRNRSYQNDIRSTAIHNRETDRESRA